MEVVETLIKEVRRLQETNKFVVAEDLNLERSGISKGF